MKYKQTDLFQPEPEDKTVKLVSLKMVCENTGVYVRAITSKVDVLEIAKPIFESAYCEIVAIICLNARNMPHAISVVNVGGVNQSMVSPANVWKVALTTNASAIIMVHNHPAGTLKPSNCDKEITDRIKEGGKLLEIDLIDHIIVNPDCSDCYSFKDHSLL